jgi:hypothetical protein
MSTKYKALVIAGAIVLIYILSLLGVVWLRQALVYVPLWI